MHCRSFSHFVNKKYWHISDINFRNFNKMWTNIVINFEQPSPGEFFSMSVICKIKVLARDASLLSVEFPQMFLLTKFEDSIPFDYLENELNATHEFFFYAQSSVKYKCYCQYVPLFPVDLSQLHLYSSCGDTFPFGSLETNCKRLIYFLCSKIRKI